LQTVTEPSSLWSRPIGYASIALYTLTNSLDEPALRKYPYLFLPIAATLALTVGCSSTAQTPPDDDIMPAVTPSGAVRPEDDTSAGENEAAEDTTTASNAAGTDLRRVTVSPQLEPGFMKVSKELRDAVGSVKQAPPAHSIELLRNLRKNLFAPPHEKQLSAYLLGSILIQQASPEAKQEAFDLFVEAAGNDALSTPARTHAADIASAANDEKKVQAVLSPLLKKAESVARAASEKAKSGSSPTGVTVHHAKRDPALPEAIYRLGESFYRAKDFGSATNVFERVRELYPDTEYATGASWYLGSISLETEHDWKTALKEFRHYLQVCPQGKNALKIVQLMVDAATPKPTAGASSGAAPLSENTASLGNAGGSSLNRNAGQNQSAAVSNQNATLAPQIELTANDRALIAMALYKHGRYADALATWDQIGSKNIYRSVCLLKTGRRAEGVTALLQAVEAEPKNSAIPDVASAFCKPVTSKEALALWQEILKRNPGQLDEALWNVAKRLGTPQGAPYYARLIAERPTSQYAPESAWWLIWSSAKQGYAAPAPNKKAFLTQALAHCDKAMAKYAHTHIGPKFAFWRGKLQEALGQKTQAIASYDYCDQQFPGSYYGYRSKACAAHLRSQGTDKPIADRKWSFTAGRANPDPNWNWPEPPVLFHWQKVPSSIGETAATLLWLRQYDEAFKYATGKIPQEIKAWVLLKQGQTLKANANASVNLEGHPQQTPRWRFAFPLAYGNIIEREARKHNLDPLLIHGLIRQESRYDYKALSRSNAMGLMQLLKGTACGVAKHNGITLNATEDIFTPDINIRLGTAYVASVLKRANNNAMLAVASYNGGPNAVARWLKQHQAQGISDMDVYVENIPYDETRDYVRKVFSHYWNYEQLYLHQHKN
jgi:soluble lytic murein transglycosylase-like protein/TolA-binding protein